MSPLASRTGVTLKFVQSCSETKVTFGSIDERCRITLSRITTSHAVFSSGICHVSADTQTCSRAARPRGFPVVIDCGLF